MKNEVVYRKLDTREELLARILDAAARIYPFYNHNWRNISNIYIYICMYM